MAKDKPTEETTTEQPAQSAAVEPELTIEQLMAQMQDAISANDFKAVSQISRKIDTRNRAVEKTALDEKRAREGTVAKAILEIYLKAIQSTIDTGELDSFDGIWITHDFGEQQPTCRLMKTATKTRSSGNGGTGKKFDITTEEMLNKHGEEPYKDSGMTIRKAYDSNTDKNWRYAIRMKLLKLEGILPTA